MYLKLFDKKMIFVQLGLILWISWDISIQDYIAWSIYYPQSSLWKESLPAKNIPFPEAFPEYPTKPDDENTLEGGRVNVS